MTVGIAAECCSNTHAPRVVIAADRMVTSGRGTRIEYEHTETKLREIVSSDGIQCMAVSSGDTSYSDDFFVKLEEKLEDSDPYGVENIVQEGVDVFQEIIKESVNRQVLGGFDMTLSDFKDPEVDLDPEIEQALLADVQDKRESIFNNLQIMFAGVDGTGAQISSITQGDIARHDSIGYHAIGSGGQPARSAFIRSRYDTSCDIEDALLSVVESKAHSEAAQGVGEKMDIAMVHPDGCHQFEDDEIKELVNLYDKILDEEQEGRENVIEKQEYNYERAKNES